MLADPEYVPKNKSERRIKSEQLREYSLQDGQLFRYYSDDDGTVLKRKVVTIDEVFDVIVKEHAVNSNHSGRDKTFYQINRQYHGIKREEVMYLLKQCKTCNVEKPKTDRVVPLPLNPTTSKSLFERVQIDLMDLTTTPDGEWKWILHIVDHWSKFSCAYPLRSKEAEEVADRLASWIGMFGPPEILECDKGAEFENVVLILAKKYGVKVINGRPRHPLSQGSANRTFKRMLRVWQRDQGTAEWARALPEIGLNYNRQVHGTTGKTPYQMLFGQEMRTARLSLQERQNAVVQAEVVIDEDSDSDDSLASVQFIDRTSSPASSRARLQSTGSVSVDNTGNYSSPVPTFLRSALTFPGTSEGRRSEDDDDGSDEETDDQWEDATNPGVEEISDNASEAIQEASPNILKRKGAATDGHEAETPEAKKRKAAGHFSGHFSPASPPDTPELIAVSRETFTDEKDTMIRYLRDNLQHSWRNVTKLYNEYWGIEVGAESLRKRYARVILKGQPRRKKAGRLTQGDGASGMKEKAKRWDWMEKWEKHGRLK
jgi:hypothetical protein